MPEEQVEFRTAGFNHQCFVYVFRDRATGDDLYPRLREIVDADPEGLGRRVRVEIFKRFGYFPTESSEHSSEYVPWFLHHPRPGGEVPLRDRRVHPPQRREPRGVGGAEVAARRGRPDRDRAQQRACLAVRRSRSRPGTPIELYGNVRNEGLIDGLPTDACVEVPVVVADGAVQPQRDRAAPAAVPGAQPDVPQRRRADGPRGGRRIARARLPSGAPRPEHGRDAHHRADRQYG